MPIRKVLEFTATEKALVAKKADKVRKGLNTDIIIYAICFFAVLILSMYVSEWGRPYLYTTSGDDRPLMEKIGVISTVAVLLVFFGFLAWSKLTHTGYANLKKDLVDNKSLTLEANVASTRERGRYVRDEYEVYLEHNVEAISKLIYASDCFPGLKEEYSASQERNDGSISTVSYSKVEFPGLKKGDRIRAKFTKNAHYVLHMERIHPV
ncbi:MAG: hypothetical protein MJA30_22625 [Cytophagales bacterium]|nr:hypothetical protein [Cytophagales bacterium]